MRKILVLLLVLFSVATFGQGEVLKQGQKVLKRSGKILKSHYPWEYNEPSDWINIHYCPKDEILITTTDSTERYVSFKATVQSSGQYTVELCGGTNGDSLINTQTINNNVQYSYQYPAGKGKRYGGGEYTQYTIRIFPTISTKKLLTFNVTKHASSSTTNAGWLLINMNCNTLTSFFLGNVTGVTPTNLRYVNFYGCININTLAYSLYGLSSMKTLTWGKTMDEVTSLYNVLNGCSSVTFLKFPSKMDKVTTISFGCKGMTSCKTIILPQSAKLLNTLEGITDNCSALETFIFPTFMDEVTTLYNTAGGGRGFFSGSPLISFIKMPVSMKKLTNLTEFLKTRNLITSIILPDTLNALVDIQKFVYQNTGIVNIQMPRSMRNLKYINSFAYFCTSIQSLLLPDTLPELLNISQMFDNCTALSNFIFPKSLPKLTNMQDCFYNCTALSNVIFPDSLPKLTNMQGSFRNCTKLENITLPKMNELLYLGGTVQYEYGAFDNCTSLTNIIFPDSLPKLEYLGSVHRGTGCFNNCTALENISLPDMPLLKIMGKDGAGAFLNCTKLKSIIIPNSCTSITYMNGAFYGCTNLVKATLPNTMNGLTDISYCFTNCSSLDTIIMPTSCTSLTTMIGNTNLLNLDTISTATYGTPQVNTLFTFRDLKTFKQPTLRVSKFICAGISSSVKSNIHTIDIDWANSTFGGTSPQIDIRWNSLSATTLDAIFTALPTVVGKTINVAGNPGSATCTPSIASLKGWTVIIL